MYGAAFACLPRTFCLVFPGDGRVLFFTTAWTVTTSIPTLRTCVVYSFWLVLGRRRLWHAVRSPGLAAPLAASPFDTLR